MHEKADTHVRMYVHARSFALRRALSSLCSHHLSSVAGLLSAFLLPLQGEREREREREEAILRSAGSQSVGLLQYT